MPSVENFRFLDMGPYNPQPARCRASAAMRLDRDQVVKISRLSSGESFIGSREKFIFNTFIKARQISTLAQSAL